jgi:hypothetical protein
MTGEAEIRIAGTAISRFHNHSGGTGFHFAAKSEVVSTNGPSTGPGSIDLTVPVVRIGHAKRLSKEAATVQARVFDGQDESLEWEVAWITSGCEYMAYM